MEAKLELRPLTGGLGAEVIGYDFDNVPNDEVIRLRRALVDHHLLLFRGLPLDPARQIAFTRLFGSQMHTCSPRTPSVPGFPEIARICSGIGPYWHSDGAHLPEPTAVSVHHVIVAAMEGDTLYAGLASAYERLSPEGRRHASRMRMRSPTGVTHPLVLSHPVTGRLGLYVNLDHDAAVIDEFGRENRAMRDGLERHLCAEGTYYRHQWHEGDTLVIDNFAIAHRVARASLLHRTSIPGPSAWWCTGASRSFPASALMAS
jgi:alpha-ketoglutarate-dependent taurine dioxygenase